MVWGVSFALHEQAIMDPRSGRLMNANLAEYHVPVNADVPSLEAIEGTIRTSMRSASKGSARSASPARRARSRMPSGTPPEFACANSRSRLIV
jgi:CO/xanthine dehydrogenase Mo-binding subunit